ncbi:MAG: PD-(D/E)XK nuclease domain-containing protein [Treponema sp.]|nr:PD-(D/E)XK nuclease domain-containing protein [Treponema sp.]
MVRFNVAQFTGLPGYEAGYYNETMQEKTKRPVRFFNTTGPCNPWDHYMLPSADRLVGAQLHRYIRDNLYWVLHAPRQTGKTTFLQSWMREINAGDEALACYVSLERCQGIADPTRAMPEICESIYKHAKEYGLPVPRTTTQNPGSMLNDTLVHWAEVSAPKLLIVLFDETDVLTGDSLISFLRQLRDGFAGRGVGKFPVSIALAGIRDLKDYITAAKEGVPVNPGSPFNIKSDSAVIGNFSQDDAKHLFAQRTKETGQEITGEALEYVWDQSRGQPWIVNSLFMRATMRILNEDNYETVNLRHIQEAREQMVLARETHLESLAYRLEDPRIRKVIETIMAGGSDPSLADSEGFLLCEDLGLVSRERGTLVVANPIYREALARQMTCGTQAAVPEPEWRWEKLDGALDMERLMKEFQQFWRENSEVWERKSNYTEAFPHLLLQAFLQRVLNGGGQIEREYAAGRGRMDLCVEYKGKRYIIEIKLIYEYSDPARVQEQGLEQIKRYRDKIGGDAGAYLVIFDRRGKAKQLPWSERLSWIETEGITIIGG